MSNRRYLVPLALCIASAALACPVHAVSTWTLPPFSLESSDGTDPALWDATWTFSYDYSAQTFDITVQNQTVDPPAAFTLTELYWNMTIPDLALNNVSLGDNSGWPFALTLNDRNDGGQKTKADGFGVFDLKLDLGQGSKGLAAGGTATFSFNTVGAPNVSAKDLFGEFTDGIPWRWAAIKWQSGESSLVGVLEEDDDSGYSTPTPEPCTLGLLLCAGPALFAIARRKR